MAAPKKEEEPKIPDYITEHKKKFTYGTRFLDTTQKTHLEAYNAAIDKHLMDGNQVNFDKLEDAKIQQDFSKTMADFYIKKAREAYKIDKDHKLGSLESEMLLQAYAGITEGTLRQTIGQYGKQFNHLRFQSLTGEINKQLQKQVYSAAASHLTEANIDDIIKYAGLDGKVKNIDLSDAVQILQVHHTEGSVPEPYFRQFLPKNKIGRPKKEEKQKAA